MLNIELSYHLVILLLGIYPEKAMAPHSSTLAWKIPWAEEPGRLQSMGSRRVGHDWATSLSRIGEENGNPLQCSRLENPRDGGAWWAAVHGVKQSQTRLKRLSSSSSSRYIPKKTENIRPYKTCIWTFIAVLFIIFPSWWMNKHRVIHPYNETLSSRKKEWSTDTCYNTDAPWKHEKWNKPNTKNTCHDPIYMKCQNKQIHRNRKYINDCQRLEGQQGEVEEEETG